MNVIKKIFSVIFYIVIISSAIASIISLIPDFLVLKKEEPKVFYSWTIDIIDFPENEDIIKVFNYLSDNKLPHGILEIDIINKGNLPAKEMTVRTYLDLKILKLLTIPSREEKVAWIEFADNEEFYIDNKMVVIKKFNNFATGKPLKIQAWIQFDSTQVFNEFKKQTILKNEYPLEPPYVQLIYDIDDFQVYYDGKPAEHVGSIYHMQNITWKYRLNRQFRIFVKIIVLTSITVFFFIYYKNNVLRNIINKSLKNAINKYVPLISFNRLFRFLSRNKK